MAKIHFGQVQRYIFTIAQATQGPKIINDGRMNILLLQTLNILTVAVDMTSIAIGRVCNNNNIIVHITHTDCVINCYVIHSCEICITMIHKIRQ